MAIARGKLRRAPTPPGAFIAEDILGAFKLTQDDLATRLGVSRRTVNQLVKGHRRVTADMALKLARLTGTSARFWMNLQTAVDLWEAERAGAAKLARIAPIGRTA